MIKENDRILRYFITGSDPGVSFSSSYYLDEDIEATIICNMECDTWIVTGSVEENILK